jgi:hypothetical protein
VHYNPLKSILILILSLKLSMQLVQKVEVTQGQHMAICRCQAASKVSLFVGFLIFRGSVYPQKTMKIGTPQIKVISQYLTCPVVTNFGGSVPQSRETTPCLYI